MDAKPDAKPAPVAEPAAPAAEKEPNPFWNWLASGTWNAHDELAGASETQRS